MRVIKFKVLGRKGKVIATVHKNITAVTITMTGETPNKLGWRTRNVWTGVSFCSPADTFDESIGIRKATAHALSIGNHFDFFDGRAQNELERAIYSAIRENLTPKWIKEEVKKKMDKSEK